MDTAARSLAHWSEDGRAEMDAFYALARRDYERLARGFVDHPAWLRRLAAGRDRITLLDVACGSGKFPQALQTDGGVGALSPELTIDYDLLDPSEFSLGEAARELRPPFVGGRPSPDARRGPRPGGRAVRRRLGDPCALRPDARRRPRRRGANARRARAG